MRTVRERTDSYAEKGGHAVRQFHFACIQSGSAAVLRSELNSALYRDGVLQLFGNDQQAARISMSFICAQAWYAAVQAGISEKTADALFDIYSKHARSACSILHLLNAQAEFLIDCADAVGALHRPRVDSVQAQKCIDHIHAHICQPLTVHQIASALGFSEGYLSKEFKKAVHQTMITYIQDEKMRTAKLLLRKSALSVQDVMSRLGYVSQSHFTKLFREKTGMTPARYRVSLQEHRGLYSAPATDTHMIEDRTEDYIRLVQYGKEKGLEQQQYLLACVRRGNARALEDELLNADIYAEIYSLFSGKLDLAIEAMLAFWPQIMHTVCDSGVPEYIAAKNLSEFTAQLYSCLSVSEVLDLNRRYLIDQAHSVSAL